MTCRITVFGGTGFIGRHLVALLLQRGGTVRHPSRVKIAAEATNSPEIVQADVLDEQALLVRSQEPIPSLISSAF